MTTILGYDEFGFNVNGVFMRGSVICTPTTTYLWDCQTPAGINTSNLAVVAMVKPRIGACPALRHAGPRAQVCSRLTSARGVVHAAADFLLIGTGEHMEFVDVSVYPFFQRRGISVETMSTVRARSGGRVCCRVRV